MAHEIKLLLTAYDQLYLGKFGVRAPLKPARDAKLAQQLLGRYTLAQLTDWLGVFFILHDPFIQQSGYGFNIFSACIGKCITSPRPVSIHHIPTQAELEQIARIRERQRLDRLLDQEEYRAREKAPK